MAAEKPIGSTGLAHLWSKLKAWVNAGFATKSHTHSAATTSADGLMSKADKVKLDGIATGANKYTHPAHTAKNSGLYKVTVDAEGHVTAAVAAAKADITALGIPAQDTTYNAATASANGLMSKADKAKLDAFSAAGDYAKKSDLANVYKYKGSVKTTADLPTGATGGDVYNVEADGMNYGWTGEAWDALGATFTIEEITDAEINAMFA